MTEVDEFDELEDKLNDIYDDEERVKEIIELLKEDMIDMDDVKRVVTDLDIEKIQFNFEEDD